MSLTVKIPLVGPVLTISESVGRIYGTGILFAGYHFAQTNPDWYMRITEGVTYAVFWPLTLYKKISQLIDIYSSLKKVSMKPGVPFYEIKSLMRTYDLLMFRGTDLISNTIAKVEAHEDGKQVKKCANFTHVGIVIRGEDMMPIKDPSERDWLHAEDVFVLESTMSGDLADGCKDVHGETHFGVQLRLLDNVVEHYDKPKKSRIAWCALRAELPKQAKDTVRAEYEKYRGLSYDLSIVDLAACFSPTVRKIRDNTAFEHIRDALCSFVYGKKRADDAGSDNYVSNWQFCSELAANIYKDIGLLPSSVNPSNAMPADFVTDPKDSTPHNTT